MEDSRQIVTPVIDTSNPSSSSSTSSSSSSSASEDKPAYHSEQEKSSLRLQKIQQKHQQQLQLMQQQYQEQLKQIQQQQMVQQQLMQQMQQQQQMLQQSQMKSSTQANNAMAADAPPIIPKPAEKGSVEEALDFLRDIVSIVEDNKHIVLPPPMLPLAPAEEEMPKPQKKCYICGSIRKKRITCARIRCPLSFCYKCHVKVKEVFGPDVFMNGCPVCKRLCCCSNHTVTDNQPVYCEGKCLIALNNRNTNDSNETQASAEMSSELPK